MKKFTRNLLVLSGLMSVGLPMLANADAVNPVWHFTDAVKVTGYVLDANGDLGHYIFYFDEALPNPCDVGRPFPHNSAKVDLARSPTGGQQLADELIKSYEQDRYTKLRISCDARGYTAGVHIRAVYRNPQIENPLSKFDDFSEMVVPEWNVSPIQ